eukprot:3355751-Rhodomonas_salina.6
MAVGQRLSSLGAYPVPSLSEREICSNLFAEIRRKDRHRSTLRDLACALLQPYPILSWHNEPSTTSTTKLKFYASICEQ